MEQSDCLCGICGRLGDIHNTQRGVMYNIATHKMVITKYTLLCLINFISAYVLVFEEKLRIFMVTIVTCTLLVSDSCYNNWLLSFTMTIPFINHCTTS